VDLQLLFMIEYVMCCLYKLYFNKKNKLFKNVRVKDIVDTICDIELQLAFVARLSLAVFVII
jgi:hypothetical protein